MSGVPTSPSAKPQPVPTAILLRNALTFPPTEQSGTYTSYSIDRLEKKGRRRKLQSNNSCLLPPPSVRIEIVAERVAIPPEVLRRYQKEDDEVEALPTETLFHNGDDDKNTDVVLHTSFAGSSRSPWLQPSASEMGPLHPRWDHLDEQFDLFQYKRPDEPVGNMGLGINTEEWVALYKSMRARVVIDVPSSHVGEDDCKSCPLILAELPLYPVDLRRLPGTKSQSSMDGRHRGNSRGDLDDEHHYSHSSSMDAAKVTVPSALPPNSLLVHYSDGSTRVDPALYHRLVRSNIINEIKNKAGRLRLDSGVLEDKMREDRKARRFDDNIFDMLGGDGESDGNEDNTEDSASVTQEKLEIKGQPRIKKSANDKAAFKDDMFDLLSGGSFREEHPVISSASSPSEKALEHVREERQEKPPICSRAEISSEICPLPSNVPCDVDDLKAEVEQLRALFAKEEEGLEREGDMLSEEMQALYLLVDDTKNTSIETDLIKEDTLVEERKQGAADFHLEARRAKVLRDLRTIFPIQQLPGKVYTINGLHLPSDLHGPGASDAVVSAALGYLCHLVYMCSKYLCIPLRYRLFCNSSRSAVQDDGVAVYPLFRERMVEREEFDRAFTLLGRNVEHLLIGRGIDFSPASHILAKLDRLFEATSEIGGCRY